MDTIETNYEDFFGAFGDEGGNQTDTAEDAADIATEEETNDAAVETDGEDHGEEAEEGSESEDSEGEENTQPEKKEATETEAEADKSISEQKFVVKVNKETREVSYQDAPAWIQKGMDYDRVKGQLETAQQEQANLQAEISKYKSHMDILEMAAEAAGVPVDQMLESVQIGMFKSKGMTESEARAELRNLRLEKQIKDLAKQKEQPAQEPVKEEPATDDKAERAQRDIEEFNRMFPDVKLTEELVGKLVPDVQKGMSLTSAYLKHENERLKAEAKQKEQAAAAKEKNKSNRANTPGSQRDSGGSKNVSTFDDFFGAFEK